MNIKHFWNQQYKATIFLNLQKCDLYTKFQDKSSFEIQSNILLLLGREILLHFTFSPQFHLILVLLMPCAEHTPSTLYYSYWYQDTCSLETEGVLIHLHITHNRQQHLVHNSSAMNPWWMRVIYFKARHTCTLLWKTDAKCSQDKVTCH